MIEVDQNFALSHFRDVVHSFTSIVPHACILVCEAGQDWWHNHLEIFGKLLDGEQIKFGQPAFGPDGNKLPIPKEKWPAWVATYGAEGDSRGCQAYQASITSMRLMDGKGELVAELIENSLDFGIVLAGN